MKYIKQIQGIMIAICLCVSIFTPLYAQDNKVSASGFKKYSTSVKRSVCGWFKKIKKNKEKYAPAAMVLTALTGGSIIVFITKKLRSKKQNDGIPSFDKDKTLPPKSDDPMASKKVLDDQVNNEKLSSDGKNKDNDKALDENAKTSECQEELQPNNNGNELLSEDTHPENGSNADELVDEEVFSMPLQRPSSFEYKKDRTKLLDENDAVSNYKKEIAKKLYDIENPQRQRKEAINYINQLTGDLTLKGRRQLLSERYNERYTIGSFISELCDVCSIPWDNNQLKIGYDSINDSIGNMATVSQKAKNVKAQKQAISSEDEPAAVQKLRYLAGFMVNDPQGIKQEEKEQLVSCINSFLNFTQRTNADESIDEQKTLNARKGLMKSPIAFEKKKTNVNDFIETLCKKYNITFDTQAYYSEATVNIFASL
jgi:hypothetical protein